MRRFLLIESENEILYYLLSVLKPIQSLFFYFQYFFHHTDMFQNNPVFFQPCQIWLNTNRQKFNSMCTVLILSCDLSDPIRSFLTALNCFDSLFLSSRCVENWFRLFFGLRWVSISQTRERNIFNIFFIILKCFRITLYFFKRARFDWTLIARSLTLSALC